MKSGARPTSHSTRLNQGVISLGVETNGVERSSCDARVWVLQEHKEVAQQIFLFDSNSFL